MKDILLLAAAGALLLSSCKKFDALAPVASPAYIRVFNDIPYTTSAFTLQQVQPFLVFLLDPVMDASGAATGAAQVGDFLTTRQPFSTSYPINAGNGSIKTNYDYPGSAHVQTAPSINGFDCSAWAAIPSGRHRILFLLRPVDNTPFAQLPQKTRQSFLIDTTLDLGQGGLNTLHVVATDLDAGKYGVYVRKESFVSGDFDPGKIYLSLYNLSGKPSAQQNFGGSPLYGAVPDSFDLFYTYYVSNTALTSYNNVYYRTYTSRFDTSNGYISLPVLSKSYFFNNKGVLLAYASMPYVSLTFSRRHSNLFEPGGIGYIVGSLGFTGDPATFNQDNASAVGVTHTLPNLNLITNVQGDFNIYGTVNIVELVYNKAYLMQVQRVFKAVSQ